MKFIREFIHKYINIYYKNDLQMEYVDLIEKLPNSALRL